jgi:protein SCO1/2
VNLRGCAAVCAAIGVAVAALTLRGQVDAKHTARTPPQPVPFAHVAALGFTPPAAGTYRLEHILQVPDGPVLGSDGTAHSLHTFTTGKITLFSFVYTYCADAQGCPLAYAALHALKVAVARDPALRGKVRLVSMSFDPLHDTPAMMRSYGGDDASATGPVPWYFLTTASMAQLAPLLAGFGQDVAVTAPDRQNGRVPVLRHMLKVYLIDPGGIVREIYSTAYLHPAVLQNDIATLLAEQASIGVRADLP